MSQRAERSITVAASPKVCFEVATQVELYPEWIPEIKEVKVLSRGDDGLPGQVFYRVGAMGRSIHYTLDYYYGSNPLRLAWRMTDGVLLRHMEGEYRFQPSPSDADVTDMEFHLAVGLLAKIPGFVNRRAEQRVITSAIDGIKNRAEQIAALHS